MKYVILLCDGMADYPVKELDGKTPMQCAKKPNMDKLASKGIIGLAKTVPDGMAPGSDVANLSVMGYNPADCYTGRSPLEAASMGLNLQGNDLAFRCNLVTLSNEPEYKDKTMIDYSAGDISSDEAAEIIKTVQEYFGNEIYSFHPGVSYRHCMLLKGGCDNLPVFTPPHDISDKVIGEYLAQGNEAAPLIELMKKSYDILKDHPVNKKRISDGKRPANSIWLWGQGTRPKLENFKQKTGLNGSVISAVDLLKGIGTCAGMSIPTVPGATGYIDTNFSGKAQSAVEELNNGHDFVYVHVEAPDECGHRGEVQNKIRSIEIIDNVMLPILLDGLNKYDDYKILIAPDHPTPLSTKTHARDPIPFLIYHKRGEIDGIPAFDEQSAAKTGLYVDKGYKLLDMMIK